MSRQTKKALTAVAVLLVLLAGVLLANYLVYPVYHSYENEDGELRVQIDGVVYKYFPDSEWRMYSGAARRIGYLNGISTMVQEFKDDDERSALYVSAPGGEKAVLIEEGKELGEVSAENVYRISYDDPDVNKYLRLFFGSVFETVDEAVISSFFDALRGGERIAEHNVIPEEGIPEEMPTEAFVLNCYNKNLPAAAVSIQVLIWNGQYICYDEAAEAFVVIPAQVFTDIAGGGFDAGVLLGEE